MPFDRREGVADMITPELGAISSPENDPQALREMLRPYIGAPELVARHGAAGRAYAERTYAAPVVAETIEGLLNTAIAGGIPQQPAR